MNFDGKRWNNRHKKIYLNMIKLMFALVMSIYCMSCRAVTVDELIAHYGKKEVMRAIADKLPEGFSVNIRGQALYSQAPSQEYVNEITLKYDIERAGLLPNDVEKLIEEKIIKNKAVQAEQQKKQRIEEAKKILEAHRKEYLARDNEWDQKKAEEQKSQLHDNEAVLKETQSIHQYKNQRDSERNEYGSNYIEPRYFEKDRKSYDELRRRGLSKSESIRYAPVLRQFCESMGGNDCQ